MTIKIKTQEDVKLFFKNSSYTVIGTDSIVFSMHFLRYFIENPKVVAIYDFADNALFNGFEIKAASKLSFEDDGLDPFRFSKAFSKREIIDFIDSFSNPLIYGYIFKKDLFEVCRKHGWKMTGFEKSQELENKIKLREILKSIGISPVPGEIKDAEDMEFGALKKKYGLPFVIQIGEGMAGKGTFFISCESDFARALEKIKEKDAKTCIACRYIESPSPTITACVTKKGVIAFRAGRQVLSDPALMNPKIGGRGVYCGTQFSAEDGMDEKALEKGYEYVKKLGEYLASSGYKGIFSIDGLYDENDFYIVDINTRLGGSMNIIPMLQAENDEMQLAALHAMEFMEEDFDFDFEAADRAAKRKRQGSYLILFAKHEKTMITTKDVKPGIYELEEGELVFKRSGFSLEDIKGEDEFIITGGIPYKGTPYVPHKRLCRMISRKDVINQKNGKLNKWASEAVKKIYDAFGFAEP